MEGPNIAEWQAQQQHQEAAGEKSGFGLGHGDSIATITDGVKWWSFEFIAALIAAYSNIIEALLNGSSLATLFGKSGNMFGIKFLEGLAEFFSGGGGDEGSGSGDGGDEGINHGDYPHTGNQIADDAAGFDGMNYGGNYQGQSFSPEPSPHVGDDHGHELSAPAG